MIGARSIIQFGDLVVIIERDRGRPIMRVGKAPYPELRAERGDP